MPPATVDRQNRLWSTLEGALRLSVALACLGTWDWFLRWEETPLLHWLLDPVDVGGLNWGESAALVTQQIVGWLVLGAGVSVLVRPSTAVLGLLALVQLLIAVAMWRTDAGFSLESAWLPPSVTALYPFATQAARIAAPLGLLLLNPGKSEPCPGAPGPRRVTVAINILRWAIAVTFCAHGIEAWQHHPQFIDYWIGTTRHLFDARMSQGTAEMLLTLIGCADFLAATLMVTTRWRAVGWWMVCWGAVTALSRITSYGLLVGWHAAAMRAPHVGVPLAVTLYWHLLRWKPRDSAEESTEKRDERVAPYA